MGNRQELCDRGFEDSVVFENPDYDDAIIGVSTDGEVVYDHYLMVKHLMCKDGMTEEEAIAFIEQNTIQTVQRSSNSPIIMYGLIGL